MRLFSGSARNDPKFKLASFTRHCLVETLTWCGLCDVFPTLGTEQHQRPRDPQLSAFGFEWLVYALPLGFVGFWEGTWWDLDGPYLGATGG